MDFEWKRWDQVMQKTWGGWPLLSSNNSEIATQVPTSYFTCAPVQINRSDLTHCSVSWESEKSGMQFWNMWKEGASNELNISAANY